MDRPERTTNDHEHSFLGAGHEANERRTRIVIALTATMMALEIAAGIAFGSMALLADGWHMASHAAALGIAAIAYYLARRHAESPRFSFGTGKIGQLAGFSSALVLGVVAILMAYESIVRLFRPVSIAFDEAIAVTILGLLCNLASAIILRGRDEEAAHRADHNIRAAYLHVLADTLTSILALAALTGGRFLGLVWLDPAIGIVGACVIGQWSYSLALHAGRTLLDMAPPHGVVDRIRTAIEGERDCRIADLHVWSVGPGRWAAIVSLIAPDPKPPGFYKGRLSAAAELDHVTVEVNAGELPLEGRTRPMLYEREAKGSVEEVTRRLEEASKANAFGVIATIDLREKMRSKGVEFGRACSIVEVCNPHQAKQVLDANMAVSTALPCRISVYEEGGKVKVATLRPTEILMLFGASELLPVARSVEEALVRIIDSACA